MPKPVFDTIAEAELAGYRRPQLRDEHGDRWCTPVHEDHPVTPASPVRRIRWWEDPEGDRTVRVWIRDINADEHMFPPDER